MAFAGRAQVIHSGHFMTSNLHNDDGQVDDDDEDIEVDVVEDDDKSEDTPTSVIKNKGLEEKPVTFYKFGPKKTQSIAIDVSLNKLNKCIKVAYNKMTTPKWKDFKGLRLHWKQRIRLNNVIWRAYYIEFRRKAPGKPKKPFCYFAVPDDDTTHQKIEGSVMEGMYWKRRMEAVCAQYKRWRVRSRHNLHMDRGLVATSSSNSVSSLNGVEVRRKRRAANSASHQHHSGDAVNYSALGMSFIDEPCAMGSSKSFMEPPAAKKLHRSQTPKHMVSEEWNYDYDDLNNVFTDELFNSLSQPYVFPNPKEMMMQTANADIMQPGLLPLQPTIEEIMASLENFPEEPPTPPSPRRPRPLKTNIPPSTSSGVQASASSASAPASATPDQSKRSFVGSVDYSQLMPTRQPSAITSQMLLLSHGASTSAPAPHYATSTHYAPHQNYHDHNGFLSIPTQTAILQRPVQQQLQPQPQPQHHHQQQPQQPHQVPHQLVHQQAPVPTQTVADTYMPQFLQSPHQSSHESMVSRNLDERSMVLNEFELQLAPRSWWLDSPLTASIQSPLSVATPLASIPSTNAASIVPKVEQQLEKRAFAPVTTPSTVEFASSLNRLRTTSETWKSPTIEPKSMDAAQEEQKDVSTSLSAPSSVKPTTSRKQMPDSTLHPEERKRILHLHAEQNRRSALKDGFEQLTEMVPHLHSGGVKPTNAVVLAKAADYIRKLKKIKADKAREKNEMRSKVDSLNRKIASLQANLPSSSSSAQSSATSPTDTKTALESFYDRYAKQKAKEDWRFWVMSRMLYPISVGNSNSFAANVAAGTSRQEIAASCSEWIQNNWKAAELRPLASTILVHLATNTSVLSDPQSLQMHVAEQVKNPL